jgi:hypothetical protein
MFVIFVTVSCCLLKHVTTLYMEDRNDCCYYYSDVSALLKIPNTLQYPGACVQELQLSCFLTGFILKCILYFQHMLFSSW